MKAKLNSLVCALVSICLVLYPSTLLADEPTPITKGEQAPFNGVLIPTLKAAEMTARLEQSDSLCRARVDSTVATAVNQKQLLLNNCIDSKKIMDNMFKKRIASQSEYIDFLEKKVTAPSLSRELVFIIGVVAGVGLTIGAGYAMVELSN